MCWGLRRIVLLSVLTLCTSLSFGQTSDLVIVSATVDMQIGRLELTGENFTGQKGNSPPTVTLGAYSLPVLSPLTAASLLAQLPVGLARLLAVPGARRVGRRAGELTARQRWRWCR